MLPRLWEGPRCTLPLHASQHVLLGAHTELGRHGPLRSLASSPFSDDPSPLPVLKGRTEKTKARGMAQLGQEESED